MNKSVKLVALFAAFVFAQFTIVAQGLKIQKMLVNGMEQALCTPNPVPEFSWMVVATYNNMLQAAYNIQVAADSISLLNGRNYCWESGKITSGKSLHLAYRGRKLEPGKSYFWRVRVWDQKGRRSGWSKPAKFVTGLWAKKDWRKAHWIGYEALPDSMRIVPAVPGKGDKNKQPPINVLPLLRKSFILKKKPRQVLAFVSGLGQFEFYANGQKISNHFLDPAWTLYSKQAPYLYFDLSSQIKPGENVIGAWLGNGFFYQPGERYRKMTGAYGYPMMIARICIEYTDGSSETIVTDSSWQSKLSPITFSSIYGGEDYDARLETTDWCVPLGDANGWRSVRLVHGPDQLAAQLSPPMAVMDSFSPINISRPASGAGFVYDFGQNASGIPSIEVEGRKGDTIKLIPAELLKPDGSANQKHTGSPVFFQFVLKGNGRERWQPRFSYYGFRYLEVQGAHPMEQEGKGATLLRVTALHTRSSMASVGSFHSSSELLNQTHDLILWAIRSNMASVMTDCPHREKLGWLEQVHLMGNAIRFNLDARPLFEKILNDLRLEQTPNGALPEFAPEYVKMDFMEGIFRESPEWGSTAILLPWYLYQWYGRKKTLDEHYPMMKRYVNYLGNRAEHYILSFGLGDWYDLGPEKPGLAQLTPKGLTATAIYYYDLQVMASVASELGFTQDARHFSELGAQVFKAFNHVFYDPVEQWYGKGSQTAQAMALYMGLVPAHLRKEAFQKLLYLLERDGWALTTGDIGYHYLLKVLEDAGRSDLIYKMNSRTDVPGYGYQIKMGATALTESWQALPTVSNNHLMLGHLMEWFYTGLAGIRPVFNNNQRIVKLEPQVLDDLEEVNAGYESAYGLVKIHWLKIGNLLKVVLDLPANIKSNFQVPEGYESTTKKRILEFGSGHYQFELNKLKK